MPIPKERVWLRAAIFSLYPLVVLGLVLWLVGEVSGLGRQAAIVAAGVLAVAVVWLIERHGAGDDQTATEGEVASAADRYWSIVSVVIAGGWCVYGFNVHETGERWWWLYVIFVPVAVLRLGYDLYDLYRYRHERAQQRDEKWAPWG